MNPFKPKVSSTHLTINSSNSKRSKGIIPEKIRSRKEKIGYETPQAEWFRTQKFQTYIWNILNSKEALIFIKKDAMKQLMLKECK